MGWVLAPLILSHGDVLVEEVVLVGLEVDLGRSDGLICDDDTLSTCAYNNISKGKSLTIIAREFMSGLDTCTYVDVCT